MPKTLGVITARGGSKGIPGKNIKPLAGKPLIAYTIEAAKTSGVFDRLVTSTDDPRIAKVANEFGCDTPFLRPAELAQDETPSLSAVQHAITWLKEHEGLRPDYVMILQPTSPLRQARHIQEAVKIITETGADSVLGVTEVPHHYNPLKTMKADADGRLALFNGHPVKARIARRQDLPKVYYSNGAIYLFKTANLFAEGENAFYGNDVRAYPMEERYGIDIDVPEDWEMAERAMNKSIS